VKIEATMYCLRNTCVVIDTFSKLVIKFVVSYQCRYCDVMKLVIMQNDKWFRYIFPLPQSESGLAIVVIFNPNTPQVRYYRLGESERL